MRTGIGFDAHAYASGTEIIIGGVSIACNKRIVAYSDGDVLLHTLCDALLGAAALGDIGGHFPNDVKNVGCSSRDMLRHTIQLLHSSNLEPVNLDTIIIAEAPKFSPFIQDMRQNIASDTGLNVNCVSVKATSTDQLGFIGREEGIAAMASVIIDERKY